MARILLTEEEKKWVADEKFLQRELKELRITKNRLTTENEVLIKKNSTLQQKHTDAEEEANKIIEVARKEAEAIVEKAKRSQQAASELKSQVAGKIAELEEKTAKANNLIKSNEGKEKNLAREKDRIDETKDKLNKITEMIKDVS